MVFGLFRKRGAKEPSRELALSSTPVTEAEPDTGDLVRLGPVLWQDIRFGMSLAEVMAIHRDAVRPADGHLLGDGTAAELEIPLLRLADHAFHVLIYARSGRVTQVTVATLGSPEMRHFHQLTGALRLRYGPEIEMKEIPDGFSRAEWLSEEGTNVMLVCYPAIGCLNVVFQNRYSAAARKL